MPKWKSSVYKPTTEPEDLQEFEVYDGPDLPTRGVFPFRLKSLWMTENKSGDDMLKGLLIVHAPGKNDKRHEYHGAPMFFNQSLSEESAQFAKAFARALGATWKAFLTQTVLSNDTETVGNSDDCVPVLRLGGIKLDGTNEVRGTLRANTYQGETRAQVGRFMPPEDAEPDDDEEEPEDDVEEDEEEDGDIEGTEEEDAEEDEESDDEDDDEESDEEEEDETPYTKEELEELSLEELKEILTDEFEISELPKSKRKSTFVAKILELQEAEEEDAEEEEEEVDYDSMSLKDLKAALVAKDLSPRGGKEALIKRLKDAAPAPY